MLVALGGLLTPSMAAGAGATTVVAGQRHTCALTSGGGIQCWGWNQFGQLGDGTASDRLLPVPVTGLSSGVVTVAAGYYHTCAVTTAGALLCWGGNQYGQLGDGTTTDRWTPGPVNGLTTGVVAVTAGYYHTCALTSAGEVQCWGANNSGRLGDGTTTDRPTPGPVSGLTSGVAAVAAGVHHSCALKDGGLQCWGGNAWGQVGDGSTIDRLAPVPVIGLTSGVLAFASGSFHGCAVIGGGTVQCWGNNGSGQLGDGTSGPTNNRPAPVPVVGLGSSVTAVTAGQLHTCVRTSTGGAACWGSNTYGQLGDATTNDRVTPAPVTGLLSGVAQVAAGQWHTCALTVSGAVSCWGYNGSGGLGDGTTSDRHTPVIVHGFEGGAPTITTVNPPAGKVGGVYLLELLASGGVSPFSWTLVSGTIPPGLTLSPQGLLSGSPLVAGTYTFRIRVTGADTASSEADLSLTIDTFRRYFAEGSTSWFFDCYLALVNPSATTVANATLYFLRNDSQTFTQNVQVPPLTRRTIDVKSVPGMAAAPSFSTILESDVEVVADRTMSWGAGGYGSHAETSIKEPAQTWYLAEGATQNGFQLYYLVENPNAVPVDVTVTYLRRSPNPAFDIVYPAIPAYTRKTIYVNREDPRLVSCDVSGVVTSTAGGPIIVERAMYQNSEGRQFNAGHDSAGVTAAAVDWFLAEGATVRTFDMFILLANSGDTGGTATITYMLTDGRTMVKSYPVDARSRQTVYVNGQRDDANPAFTLANVSLSAMVHSTVPIIVERAMWWSAARGGPWIEAHDSAGTTETGTVWAVADGEQGGVRKVDTYVLVANTSSFPGRVRVTAVGEDGLTPWVERDVPAHSRSTFYMGDPAFGSGLIGTKFGVIVESLPTPDGTAATVVERAMYSNAGGVAWAAGTDLVATKLK